MHSIVIQSPRATAPPKLRVPGRMIINANSIKQLATSPKSLLKRNQTESIKKFIIPVTP